MFAYAPVMFSGGTCALITGIFCNVSDVTTEKNRAIRMGITEGVLFAGIFIGSISSSYILQWTNSSTVFAISGLSCLLGLLYIWLCVSETVNCDEFEGVSPHNDSLYATLRIYYLHLGSYFENIWLLMRNNNFIEYFDAEGNFVGEINGRIWGFYMRIVL